MEVVDTVSIPYYALSYLINGDDSGLEPEDRPVIDAWLDTLPDGADFCQAEGDYYDGDYGPSPYFTQFPAFGLPCACYEVNIYV